LSANVFTFPGRAKGPQPWTNDELAELYRVVDLLGRAGLSVATDMGMSDEGDPWFVFCRADNDEVIAHFARIDGVFVAASIAVDETFRGANFRQIVDRMVSSQPLVVPPPRPGSRLLLHPAVLLTAFVATALAHSEKMLAQDWLRSVEAQWEHGKENALHTLKQVKTGWADAVHSLMKLPINDARLAYDSAKEGLNLTLASLIAIAMTALQPISEKITIISQLVDEFPAHAATAAHQVAEHLSALAIDPPAIAGGETGAGTASGHGGDASHANPGSPMAHKVAPSAALDAVSSDGAKASVDAAHMAAPVVQKAAADDFSPHLTIDSQIDANLTALAVQKVITLPTPQTEAIVVHVDTGVTSIPTPDLQDLTADAVHLLNIHVDPQSDASSSNGKAASSHPSSDPASQPQGPQAPAVSQLVTNGSSTGTATTPPVVAVSSGGTSSPSDSGDIAGISYVGGNEIIDGTRVSGASEFRELTNFMTDGWHSISQPVSISDPIAQQELAGILSVYGTVKVVFFESTSPTKDVFLYSPGVVWVEAKDVAGGHLSNPGGNLIIESGAGGTITLLGVATAGHSSDSV